VTPATLTIAVVMDSMDWFNPEGEEAEKQIRALNRALKIKGRVMVRSAGLQPWYLKKFEENGFQIKCMGRRNPGTCIDRYVFYVLRKSFDSMLTAFHSVNMYASCWICTKTKELTPHPGLTDLQI
jgi:betaine lipid synthase